MLKWLRKGLSRRYVSSLEYVDRSQMRSTVYSSVFYRKTYQVSVSHFLNPDGDFLDLLKRVDDFKYKVVAKIKKKNRILKIKDIKSQANLISTLCENDFNLQIEYKTEYDKVLSGIKKIFDQAKLSHNENDKGLISDEFREYQLNNNEEDVCLKMSVDRSKENNKTLIDSNESVKTKEISIGEEYFGYNNIFKVNNTTEKEKANLEVGKERLVKVLMSLRILHDFRIEDNQIWSEILMNLIKWSDYFKDFPDLAMKIIDEMILMNNLFTLNQFFENNSSNSDQQVLLKVRL